jgi:hypothetical protein
MFGFPRKILTLKFCRPSHRDVFEHRSEWADSRELQSPTSNVEGRGKGRIAQTKASQLGTATLGIDETSLIDRLQGVSTRTRGSKFPS